MPAAPGLLFEANRLARIGGQLLGICGDRSHTYGYHVPSSQLSSWDYSMQGAANQPVGNYCCAIDVGMDWTVSRVWLEWLIQEIRDDRITGISEVIGSFDGVHVRYWSDIETPQWQQNGVPYGGPGHDSWTHVGIYRSTAYEDHKILAGWTAHGFEGGNTQSPSSGGGVMTEANSRQWGDYGQPDPVGGRAIATMIDDMWGQEQDERSPYDGALSARTQRLRRIEDIAGATKQAVEQLATPSIVLTDEQIRMLANKISEGLTERVASRVVELIGQKLAGS